MNIIGLKFKRIIAHEIVLGDDGKFRAKCENDIIPLNDEKELDDRREIELRSRITDLLAPPSSSLLLAPQQDSNVLKFAQNVSKMPKPKFIELSKKMANDLARAQQGTTKEGMLLVIHAINSESEDILIFIKGEYGTGFEKRTRNKGTASLRLVDKIILVSGTKLYKIGAFYVKNKVWKCALYDHLVTKSNPTGAADYFYRKFLRCEFEKSDAEETRRFYMLTYKFINDNYHGEEKMDLINAMILYLKKSPLVHTRKFGDMYFGKTGQKYFEFMRQGKFPERAIHNDVSRIQKRLLKFRTFRFRNNASVQYPPEEHNKTVHILENLKDANKLLQTGDWTFVCINSKLSGRS